MDTFNIGNIEKFNNSSTLLDNSYIGKVIQEIVSLKSSNVEFDKANLLPYSIEDKLDINEINSTYRLLILETWARSYDSVEYSLKSISGIDDSRIFDEIFVFYRNIFLQVLIELRIDCDNTPEIKKNSCKIFQTVNERVKQNLFHGKEVKFKQEELDNYIFAITVYVFYRCKILIPITR